MPLEDHNSDHSSIDALLDVFRRESENLLKKFEEASSLGEGTSQEVSDFRENAFRSFVSRFYPHPFRIVKGKLRDSNSNKMSASIDCLIINPEHPYLIDEQDKFKLLLVGGTDAAIEVKPDLSRNDELIRGLKQGQSVKKLKRDHSSIVLHTKAAPKLVEESKRVPFFLYSHKVSDPSKTAKQANDWYKENNVPIDEQLDFIVVNGVGIIMHLKHSERAPWAISPPAEPGWYFENWGELTLGGMLLALEHSYSSRASIQESVLLPFLQKLNRQVHRLNTG